MPVWEECTELTERDYEAIVRRFMRDIQRAGSGASRLPMRNLRQGDVPSAIGSSPQKQRIDMTIYLAMQLTYDPYSTSESDPFVTILFRDLPCGYILNISTPSALENGDGGDWSREEGNKLAMGPCNGFNWDESGCESENHLDDQVLIIDEQDERSEIQ